MMAVLAQTSQQQRPAAQKRVVLSAEQKKQLQHLQGQMRGVKNQMDFVEILSNFWPIGNMDARVTKLEKEMYALNHQYNQVVQSYRTGN